MGLVDVCSPGDTHAEIAIAALDAGKHVLCEKPLANTVDEARAMVAAAERARAGGCAAWSATTTGACPRWRWPGGSSSRAGSAQIRHVRAQYLQDWIVDPEFPLVWRLQRSAAGSGALGDIGAHIVDMAQYLTGDLLTGVSALTETFVRERPLPPSASSGLAASGGRIEPDWARNRRCRRRGPVPRPVRRRRGGVVRGDAVRHRPQERAAHRAQRQRAARSRSTRSG